MAVHRRSRLRAGLGVLAVIVLVPSAFLGYSWLRFGSTFEVERSEIVVDRGDTFSISTMDVPGYRWHYRGIGDPQLLTHKGDSPKWPSSYATGGGPTTLHTFTADTAGHTSVSFFLCAQCGDQSEPTDERSRRSSHPQQVQITVR
ncbi:hypothetical protein D5S17_16025 [Pseudonocardiaceae bacterium YIM PH 21723]|nr:hypothetical protein D5S17_16025 [Pseudonocardiaceae bacterium YIM PH 21723]